mmetsp:Transcript_75846/g.167998  ORF Transcript_75846/g.167998 Transcript_75846/m.167998 type:complete len:207 (-) Transcript_75846:101-721(-)
MTRRLRRRRDRPRARATPALRQSPFQAPGRLSLPRGRWPAPSRAFSGTLCRRPRCRRRGWSRRGKSQSRRGAPRYLQRLQWRRRRCRRRKRRRAQSQSHRGAPCYLRRLRWLAMARGLLCARRKRNRCGASPTFWCRQRHLSLRRSWTRSLRMRRRQISIGWKAPLAPMTSPCCLAAPQRPGRGLKWVAFPWAASRGSSSVRLECS